MGRQTLLLALANFLIPVAILVFATGFFPYKPFMPGLATFEALGWEEKFRWTKTPEPQFDRLVFMVVDALRSDFVFGRESGMTFVQSLIRDGSAIPFTAHATSPTITMPRVKAMTTGSIPSFLDVILNFAESDTTSTLATQDTWLAQLKAKEGGNLVMYGDDTWLKLFPGFFERADGTSSFFVSDFTEVDTNVTRHVPEELLNGDWNAMILHYLGLDHIGHKAGPKSPNMIPKQVEMDGIVRQIYDAIENEDHLSNTLFVLCGDHGMNDGGNHGGSAPGETSPALVFMSSKLKKITEFMDRKSPVDGKGEGGMEFYKKVEQSDIAPTLAGLLGFPVPRNNLGVFIEDFLYFWDDGSDRIQLLLRNARQVKRIVEATFPSLNFDDKVRDIETECAGELSSGENLACRWQGVVQIMETVATIHPKLRVDQIYYFLRAAQDVMSSTASNYDVSRLILGTSISLLSFGLTFATLLPTLSMISSTGIFYSFTLILYGVLMFASSYVEEEHHFWYWTTSAWFLYLFITESRKQWFPKFLFHPAIMLLFLHRIIRRWNQTGQKYAGAPDIVHSPFLRGSNSLVLWSLIGATYMDITIRLSRHVARTISDGDSPPATGEDTDKERFMGTLAVLPLGITAFMFKLAFTARDAPELVQGITAGVLGFVEDLSLVGVARMVFVGIALSASWIGISEWRRSRGRRGMGKGKGKEGVSGGGGDFAPALFDLLSLFLITQTRAQNIPLYLLFRMQLFFLTLLDLPPLATTLTTILLTQTSFFALGNTNAISSIDLSNSYNGISGYAISAVGFLVFVSNWAGPIYWSIAGILLLGGYTRSGGTAAKVLDAKEIAEETKGWVVAEREYLETLIDKDKHAKRSRQDGGVFRQHVAGLSLFTVGAVVAVMAACTALRSHLFIWTVFSPKFLYAMAWGVAFHLGVSVGVGGVVWWVGSW
ncbi:GPI ethanolamine phosphate transferas-like protein 2 [Lindgomyces ingoldianus]|uniref:GPI ethanolamine phosphate transferas-like protein 2 n=1 Tax=Lindgomyces ingoldianus TaxID=673940 RepID=A0ACB6R4Z2_9PLEO|nr:GPI ethanolamine phosphate transferas-like protein 2 [Lindgomyces ingoldianus]KAF2474329.1 GPI ethanolamine phosphate transferas-like protein 2 [Lindgomyces ingoldianus]